MIETEQHTYIPATHLDVLTPQQFIADIQHESQHAQERVWAQTMEIDFGPQTQKILETLKQGAGRGLDARLQLDDWAFHTTDGTINSLHRFYPSETREVFDESKQLKRDVISNLEQNDVHVTITNPIDWRQKIYPFKGRDHRKFFVTDDTVWFGGINLHDGNLNADDFMVKFTDFDVTRHLISLYQKVNEHKPLKNEELIMTDEEDITLLVDRGTPFSSVIFDRGIQMIHEAESSIKLTSQFIPDNDLLDSLYKAYERGIDVDVLNPHRQDVDGIFKYAYRAQETIMRLKQKDIPRRFMPEFIHAKLLLIDEENEETQQAMFGSHNLSRKGVILGTSEAAIQTTNPTLIKNLSEFYDSLAARSMTT